jgi:hypothetical protein
MTFRGKNSPFEAIWLRYHYRFLKLQIFIFPKLVGFVKSVNGGSNATISKKNEDFYRKLSASIRFFTKENSK